MSFGAFVGIAIVIAAIAIMLRDHRMLRRYTSARFSTALPMIPGPGQEPLARACGFTWVHLRPAR